MKTVPLATAPIFEQKAGNNAQAFYNQVLGKTVSIQVAIMTLGVCELLAVLGG